jgi:hypothetical protein
MKSIDAYKLLHNNKRSFFSYFHANMWIQMILIIKDFLKI